MNRSAITRRDFLHGILHPANATTPKQPVVPDYPAPDLLPPDFTADMLRQEVIRLGGDPSHMQYEDMAALVIRAMYESPVSQ